jgi:hypothetical protein
VAFCLVPRTARLDADCLWLLAPACFSHCTLGPGRLSASYKPTSPGTPIISTLTKPGRRLTFAREQPGPTHTPGNQSLEACTWWTRLRLMRATKRSNSELPVFLRARLRTYSVCLFFFSFQTLSHETVLFPYHGENLWPGTDQLTSA